MHGRYSAERLGDGAASSGEIGVEFPINADLIFNEGEPF